MVTQDVTCHGGNDGVVQATVYGTNSYSVQWSNNTQSLTNSNLEAGTYTVTVTNTFGTSSSVVKSITLSQPTQMYVEVASTPETSIGANDGTASVTNVLGGTPPFIYFWQPFGGTSATANNLSSGTYSVIVRDAAGCEVEKHITINSSTQPNIQVVSITQPTCHNSSDGSISVATVGSTSSSTNYWWSPYGGFQSTAANLTPGIYTVYAMDANGNYLSKEITLMGPDPISIDEQVSQITCYGSNDGEIDLNVNGGSAPYTYNWMGVSSNSNNVSGLAPGVYECTVTDANGCSNISDRISITSPFMPLSVSAIVTGIPTCANTANGSAIVQHLGGAGPYSYLWMPTGQTTEEATNLGAGIHTVTITDALGCIVTGTVNITSSFNALTGLNATSHNITCTNYPNGEISVAPVGGDAPYSYSWSSNVSFGPQANNLSQGTYTVIVTDANGCTASNSGTISTSSYLNELLTTKDDVTFCSGSSATLQLTTIAGNSYKWLKYSNYTGDFGSSLKVLKSGNYSVEVTTPDGCRYLTNKIKIKKLSNPIVSLDKSGLINFCANEKVQLKALSNTAVSYQWYKFNNVITGAVNNTFQSNWSGKYYVKGIDVNGCVGKSNSVRLKKLRSFNVSISPQTSTTFCQGNYVVLDAVVNGGISPYSYKWFRYSNEIAGQTTSSIKVDKTGGYKVYVTDANGCQYSNTGRVKVSVNCRLMSESFGDPSNSSLQVYPNPFKNKLTITLPRLEEEETEILLSDIYGRVVHKEIIASALNYSINVQDLETGYYILQVKQGKIVDHLKVLKK